MIKNTYKVFQVFFSENANTSEANGFSKTKIITLIQCKMRLTLRKIHLTIITREKILEKIEDMLKDAWNKNFPL